MTWIAWLELASVVVLGTIGQIVLKYALRQTGVAKVGVRRFLTPPMIIWLVCYAATTVLWLLALRTVPLSQAFPILGLQFALIPLASSRLLQEKISAVQWIGISVIMLGVALVGQS